MGEIISQQEEIYVMVLSIDSKFQCFCYSTGSTTEFSRLILFCPFFLLLEQGSCRHIRGARSSLSKRPSVLCFSLFGCMCFTAFYSTKIATEFSRLILVCPFFLFLEQGSCCRVRWRDHLSARGRACLCCRRLTHSCCCL